MDFKELKVDKLHHSYSVTVSPQEYEIRLNERLMEMGKTAKIPGFRPGKIPLSILKQRFEDSVKAQVVDRIVQLALEKLYKDKNLKPALKPAIDFQAVNFHEKIEFTVSFDVLPTLDTLKLEDIHLEQLTSSVPQEKIDDTYKNLKEKNRTLVDLTTPRASRLGDVVTIDFIGKCEGNLIPNGSGKDVPLELGSSSFIDTFETQLVDKNIGDVVDVHVTFPENYQEKKLAGKPAHFNVTLKDIREYTNPEIDDEFAKKIGFPSLEELDKALKDQLQAECDRMGFLITKRQLLDILSEKTFDVPQGLVDVEFETIWKHYLQLEKENEAKGEIKEKSAQTEEDMEKDKEQYKRIAERRVRLGLVLAEVGREYDIHVTKREVDDALVATIRRYPGQEKKVYEYFKNTPEALSTLKAPIFEDKVVKFIIDKATVTKKTVSYEELETKLQQITEGDE